MQEENIQRFTNAYFAFTRVVRKAIRERLESAYGDDWWQRGVWPALTEAQKSNLTTAKNESNYPRWEDYLEARHFARIVYRNHSALFAETFPNFDAAVSKFRFILGLRDEWAHVPRLGLGTRETASALDSMKWILLALNARETLEIDAMMEGMGEIGEQPVLPIQDNGDEVEIGSEVAESPRVGALEFWQELQSYLVVDSTVEPVSSQREPRVSVTLRASNVAPSGDSRPEVSFSSVVVDMLGKGKSQSIQFGPIGAGEAQERKVEFFAKELVGIEFLVRGDVDLARFFQTRKRISAETSYVGPLVEEFRRKFEAIGISQPIIVALNVVEKVQSDMSLSEAAKVRQGLAEIAPLIDEKAKNLNDLFREFHLDRQGKLGSRLLEVRRCLGDLVKGVENIDNAIAATDASAIQSAVERLDQLRLALLKLEQTFQS